MENLILATADSSYGSIYAMLAAFLGTYTLFIVIMISIVTVPMVIVEYLIPAIALNKMAKNAGYKYPWLAFIPIAQTYLEFVLPKREFNLGFKTKERKTMAYISIGATYFGGVVVGALNTIPVLGQVLDLIFPIVLQAVRWRKMYDVMRTYKEDGISMAISIVSVFIPIVYSCALLSCMNQEPEYGWGRYELEESKN